MLKLRYRQVLGSLPAIALLLAGLPLRAGAQIIPDATLPTNSTVPGGCTLCTITDGTQVVGNLFHSFSQFSVPTGGEAFFDNPSTVTNIITRVTGGTTSTIDGLIRANGTANLFLLNPNGIVFGPNASLDLRGSFIASTANSLRFSDGSEFSAVNPQAPPLLIVNVPFGLQYGANPAPIRVEEPGNGVFVDPSNFEFVRFGAPGLQVLPGQTLALVGGDVAVPGGSLSALGGRVEVGSVQSAGLVTLTPDGLGWRLGYDGISNFGSINLSQNAVIDVAAPTGTGGEIRIQGERVTLIDGSTLLADTRGAVRGGDIWVTASESLEIIGIGEDAFGPLLPSSILTDVSPTGATGQGGNITIVTRTLRVADGGFVSAGTFGAGNAGRLSVQAETIALSGGSSVFGSSGLLVDTFGTGRGGNAIIEAEELLITGGARASAKSFGLFGSSDAGELRVNAQTIDLRGTSSTSPSALSSSVEAQSAGNGGNLIVTAGSLRVSEGAQIAATTFGAGNAGNLEITAQTVELVGTSPDGRVSGIFASADVGSTGDGGNLTIQAGQLRIAEGAQAIVSTFGSGDAGNLTVNAGSVELVGGSGNSPSGLLASVEQGASGDGGDLTIQAEQLRIADGAQAIVSTFGSGDAGNLTVNAGSVELVGGSGNSPSGLLASVEQGASGDGGDLTIQAERLRIADGAQAIASTFGSGNAGNLTVNAGEVELIGVSGSSFSGLLASVEQGASGDGGNLTIQAEQLRIADGAQAIASTFGSGNAGNLTVNAGEVELIGISDNSPSGLLASAERGATGNGGNLVVETGSLWVAGGAQIITSTNGSGNAGNLLVNAQTVELLQSGSGLFASALVSTGAGGDVRVISDRLSIHDGATISASNFHSQNLLPPGQGAAGSVQIRSGIVSLDRGTITAASNGGDQGNIQIDSQLLLLRNGSRISTNALGSATGGNIAINTGFLIAFETENSDITANAVSNFGGRVTITAQGIFGIAPRTQLTPLSDITASSDLGPQFSGTVEIRTPDVDPSRGLVKLPTRVDNSQKIAATCEPTRGNSFVITGRGGLPQDASQPLSGGAVWQDLRLADSPLQGEMAGSGNLPGTLPATALAEERLGKPFAKAANQIVEARGWSIDADGTVSLIAHPVRANGQGELWYRANCNPSQSIP
jgi:filamentous hemagglutinin family protein